MRLAVILDATRHGAHVGNFADKHAGAFDLIVVSRPPRSTTRSRDLADRVKAGEPILVFDIASEAASSALVENTIRHFTPDRIFLLEPHHRIVTKAGQSLRDILSAGPSDQSTLVLNYSSDLQPEVYTYSAGRRNPDSEPPFTPETVSVKRARVYLTWGKRWASRHDPHRRAIRGLLREIGRRHPDASTTKASPPADSGVLDANWHIQKPFLDLPPFSYIWDRFRPNSVLDIGCGTGGYLGFFTRLGATDVVGVDGFPPTATYLGGDRYLQHDLREPLHLDRQFDLVVCTEVVEHLRSEYEEIVLNTVADHASDAILFSAARPGQPGEGHVNCRPMKRWLRAWRERGWSPDPFDTLAVRSLSNFHWFRRNLVVLRRDGNGLRGDFDKTDLRSFEAEHVPWSEQAPGVCTRPLERELSPALIP